MRIAIFVYQSTSLKITTSESDLQLCAMDADTVPLSEGDNALTLASGIYKIVSSQEVIVTGSDVSAFDVVITTSNKTNDPGLTLPRVTQTFTSLDVAALHAFMAVPEAKVVLHP